MKYKRRPHVWIVEMRDGGAWLPCCCASLTRRQAEIEMEWWRGEHDERWQYRVARYERSKP
jgi:hypothetical protein